MSKDEKPLQHIFDLFDPLVREGWTVDRIVDSVIRTTFFFGNGTSVYLKKSEFTVDYPARTRVRIDANRVPFTVGCVDVNHGDGFDMLRICAADPGDQKPVVMFRLNQYTLDGKEMVFNAI